MADYLANLKARRDAVAAEIASISSTLGLPNANGPGLNVDYTGKIKSLYEELASLNKLVAAADVAVEETEEC